MAEDAAVVGASGPMPKKATIGVLDGCVWRSGKPIMFTLTLDAKDLLNLVLDAMCFAGGIDEVVTKLHEFGTLIVNCETSVKNGLQRAIGLTWCHLL